MRTWLSVADGLIRYLMEAERTDSCRCGLTKVGGIQGHRRPVIVSFPAFRVSYIEYLVKSCGSSASSKTPLGPLLSSDLLLC